MEIEIRDLSGKVSLAERYSNKSGKLTVDVSGLASGVYLLRLKADQAESVHKIMKR